MKTRIILVIAATVSLSVNGADRQQNKSAPHIPSHILELYEPSEFNGMPYRLMKPAGFDPEKSYPLILSLHGAGGKGDDNLNQLKIWTHYLADEELRKKHPCFVLSPQATTWWKPAGEQIVPSQEMIDALDPAWDKFKKRMAEAPPILETGYLSTSMELIEKLCDEYQIDRSRIYVLGHSMGGFGSWTAIWNYPETFAAAIPCAGGIPPWYSYEKFKDVPVWAFHSADDHVVSVEFTRAVFKAAKETGSNMKYTEFEGVKHSAQVPAFSYRGDEDSGFKTQFASDLCDPTQNVWDWLFRQNLSK